MRTGSIYRTSAGFVRKHFGYLYTQTLLQILFRLPFFLCIFLLFADAGIKKQEWVSRYCLFAFAAASYFFLMLPGRFIYARRIRGRMTEGISQPVSYRVCAKDGFRRALYGLPVLPFIGCMVFLWWVKNITYINQFFPQLREMGAFLLGGQAGTQDKYKAGIAVVLAVILFFALIAFVFWQMCYGAECRGNDHKLWHPVRKKQLPVVCINAGLAVLSVMPVLVSLYLYVTGSVSGIGSVTTRLMTLISLLGTLPPAWVIAVCLLDMLLLWAPVHLFRKTVCIRTVMDEEEQHAAG